MTNSFHFTFTNKLITKLYFLLFLTGIGAFAQDKKVTKYSRYIDSANTYSSTEPRLSALFLDSIPKPVTKTIEGNLAAYYLEKAHISLSLDEVLDVHKYYSLAVKYGKEEKNYDAAGTASLGLFSQIYFIKKDSSALVHLKNARRFFELSGNKLQLLEVNQMPAYMKFLDNNFKASNELILKELEASKAVVDEDAYYYLYALYLIVTNYLHTDSIEEAKKYYNDFQKLTTNKTVDFGLYQYYDCNIKMCFVHYYFDKKQNDSTLHYLAQASKLRGVMSPSVVKDYYRQYAETYKRMDNLKASTVYLDSLILYNDKLIDETIKSSYSTNEELVNIGDELQKENKENVFNKTLLYILGGVLLLLLTLYLLSYKKLKKRLKSKLNQINDLSYLKTNHEKLKIKTQGLEAYISDLKEQIKLIATVDTSEGQRGQIKDLYRSIQLKSSDILDQGKTHYELINELNADFFEELKTTYPDLSDSEVIVCYYLCIGFKNKEIGNFLNRSTRSIESKRYRISKKIGLSKDTETLLEHLNELFKSFNLPSES